MVALLVVPALTLRAPEARASITHPVPHVVRVDDPDQVETWFERHRSYVARAKRGDIPLLLLGDSLTYGWSVQGRSAWDATFASRGAVAFGIGGDRTEDLLWRIAHGELDSAAPKMVLLEIGTNDLGSGLDAAETARGIIANVRAIAKKQPAATILLLGVLPRGRGPSALAMRRAIADVNARIAKVDDGGRVRFHDCKDVFADRSGDVRPELFEPDLLHLSPAGYRVWAVSLDRLIGGLTAKRFS
ncbi:MAG: GDSL family lipase [Candidatus Eremiobacteraeota bacterium]|nr:GDSL family lipase [Candidatus Eremiobacteraeota bacterium]